LIARVCWLFLFVVLDPRRGLRTASQTVLINPTDQGIDNVDQVKRAKMFLARR